MTDKALSLVRLCSKKKKSSASNVPRPPKNDENEKGSSDVFFLLYAAWVRSRAERPSVSYTKVVMEVAWTGHNLQFTKTN